MNAADTAPTVLMISQDLFFPSKVTGTANQLGLRVEVERNVAQAKSKLATSKYRCLILDLAMPGVRVAEVIGALPDADRPLVIAFGAHVLTDRLQEAREAGCDEVMPRSKFSATLPEILARFLSV